MAKKIIDVHVASKAYPQHGHGIGDAIMMIPVFRAIADANPDSLVRAIVKENREQWVHLGYPHTLSYDELDDAKGAIPLHNEVWPQLWESPGGDQHAIDAGICRQELWAHDAGVKLLPVKPIIPEDATIWASDILHRYFKDKPVVWISPWACSVERTWPIRHWAELVDGLLCRGYHIAGIRAKDGVFLDGVMWFEDKCLPADRTAALFEKAALVIGNDSGMVHVAGFVGAPGLAICGPTDGETIFKSYPTVRWIDSPYFCSGCLGLTNDYNPRWCKLGCNAMTALQSKDVLAVALEMLEFEKTKAACP